MSNVRFTEYTTCSWGDDVDCLDTLEPIGSTAIRSKQLGVQICNLIGYGDNFKRTAEMSNTEHIKIFEATESKDVNEMVSDFVAHLFERRAHLSSQKRQLLLPLYKYVEAVRGVFVEYFESLGVVEQNIRTSFSHSPWGQFKQHLDKLVNDMVCFAFRGESYDLPLLFKPLRKAVTELTSSRIDIIKNGSKISRISFRDTRGERIVLSDCALLLSPGFSLSKFAEKCGVAEKKLIFPFGCFQDQNFLKQTQLPSDRKSWFDRLRQCTPEDSVIEEAHEAYRTSGASNLGEYLKKYLTLDVSLTGRATLIHLFQFFKEHNCHAIDTGRLTISSFSFDAAQKFLFRKKRPAFFHPDHPMLYGCSKMSCIGGLSCVFRSAGGQDPLIPDTWPKNSGKCAKTDSAGILYLDYNSLYSFS